MNKPQSSPEPHRPLWVVTGGTGLVGENLLNLLCAKNLKDFDHNDSTALSTIPRIRASYRDQNRIGCQKVLSQEDQHSIEWMLCDLTQWGDAEKLVEGAELVFHCAALISYDPKDRTNLRRQNAQSTARLVDACLANNVRRLVYVSSIAALGAPDENKPVDEDTPWSEKGASSVYGRSKFAAELEVWRGQEEGLEIIVVNPSVILGTGAFDTGSNQMFTKVQRGLKFYSSGSLGIVDVRDVAKACLMLHQHNLVGQRFLLNGANLTFKALFDEMATCLGCQPPTLCPPYGLAKFTAAILQRWANLRGQRNYISAETVKAAYTRKHYDGSRILRALPQFHYTPWTQTIADGAAHRSLFA
ncbi:MAG: NAD-dependent epimerase/dehydratase family protein [Sphingomonadales bacterium]|nr:NAD-dependent epimerase/dehydratase family protein [Sphingomonadales bacterium]